MLRSLVKDSFRFFILIFFQVLILNNINLGGLFNPYLYILFIILLPFEISGWLLLTLSFVTGFSVDYFSHQHGLHTAACVFLGFVRPSVLKYFAPREGYENVVEPNIYIFGFRWFFKYIVICTIIHHVTLFYLEIFRFSDFFFTLARVIVSAIFTVVLIILTQYMFYRK
jgi:rod shape-determining protein MreD